MPIRKPGSVYLPKQLAPIPGDTPIEVKILIKVKSEKDDLEKCVNTAVKLGGTSYFGLYHGDPVFKTELDPQEFFKQLLDAGVWLKGLFIIETYYNGFQNVRALIPTWARCEGCGQTMKFDRAFSRHGRPMCDSCLQKLIELPREDGNEDHTD